MRIGEFLKKAFGIKDEVSRDISSFTSLVNVPTREQLVAYDGIVDFLDEIKNKYIQILSSKRLVFSKDLNYGNLRLDMSMYYELIMNLINDCEKSEYFLNATSYIIGTKKLDYMVLMGKLNSYFASLKNLEAETIIRLVALKEILDEKDFLSPLKKNSIREELNNLSSTYISLRTQRIAIKVEVDRFLTEYEVLESEEFENNEVEDELINSRCQSLRDMISVLDYAEFDKNNLNENSNANIIFMEEILERYVYNHKNEARELRDKLNDLSRYLKDNLELENISGIIRELEIKTKVFFLYGRNLITEEDIFNLYRLKFACLTRNYMKEKVDLVTDVSHIELECYQEVITQKISDILMGHNSNFNGIFKTTYKDTVLYAIKIFTNIIKEDGIEFSFWNIINNRQLLGLLVAFDKRDGLKEYFDNIMVEKKEYLSTVDFHEDIFKYNLAVPLSTVFDALYYSGEETFSPSYDLYKMMKEQEDNLVFRLPLGLTKVNLKMSYHDLGFFDWKFVQTIRDKSDYAWLEFPSSLVEIEGNIFENIHSSDVELNEGLKIIGDSLFEDASIGTIYIPSSLEIIEYSSFRGSSVDEFYFIDYQHSKLKRFSIENLITNFYVANKTGNTYKHFISGRVKRKQRKFEKGLYKDYDDPELEDHNCNQFEFKLSPTFSRIVLCDENRIPLIIIESEELEIYSRRNEDDKDLEKNITSLEVNMVLNKIKEIITRENNKDDIKKKIKK